MAGTWRSGKVGRAVIGGATVKITRWRIRLYTKLRDVTSWDCAGFAMYQNSGIQYGDIELEFGWDFTVFPFGTTIVTPGGTATVQLYGDQNSGTTFFTGTAYYEELDIGTEIRGVAKGSLRGKYSGTITKPTT